MRTTWFQKAALQILAAGALMALAGALAIAIIRAVDRGMAALAALENTYIALMAGFILFAILACAYAAVERAGRGAPEEPAPPPPPEPEKKIEPALAPADLSTTFKQMKTFIDLEMWELALEKANDVRKRFPESRESQIVARHMNDLKWKAEPKFVAQGHGSMTADQERTLQSKGLAAMLQHVKTYMELEMWELAREKAVTIMKNFPDSKEANELVPLFPAIEKKCATQRETVPAEGESKK